MGLTLRSFLLFLRNLVTFICKRWDQSTRGLWYIFALLRSRFSPRRPKKRSEIRGNHEPRPVKPSPTTVICASRLPPRSSLTPIIVGDTSDIAPPTVIPIIEVRQPTIPNSEDTDEYHENSSHHLNADGFFLEGIPALSRSPGNSACHDGPQAFQMMNLKPSTMNLKTSTISLNPSHLQIKCTLPQILL
jgi:hypothetical protein